ncbi:helix-turn-helix transcriptional regulator [Bradyrhizobium acaciae]|uniref:helix-turn-helix transcriptional regulator n=1 Tax=Bradyrhizobium acaciae TaxID=2683706 RepID=UPI001E5A8F16|nr:helix-turn-helix transcriptional regulator [Bradyrhizobium acaciae]MCC8977599.1 helix-turn-helix transcriptional regulator [Bradyrhizobium acaciae]
MHIMKIRKRYLRSYRLRFALSQAELAYLIGCKGRNRVSDLERGVREPTLAEMLSLYILFGTEVVELFPAFFAEIEGAILSRGNDLYERLQGIPLQATPAKLDCLEAMFKRVEERKNRQKRIIC